MEMRIIVAAALVALSAAAQGQAAWNKKYQDYIDRYRDLAIEQMLKHGVPASITIAQGILESAAGTSELAVRGNNHFGIKCHGWGGRTMRRHDDAPNECFRAYDSVLGSFEDHSGFLSGQPRYSRLFKLDRRDYRGWARGLKECGYATNPAYASKLIGLIELYKLHELDRATTYDKFMARHSATDKPASPGAGLHLIHRYNDNYYVYARSGDTFAAIASETGFKARKIAAYNELPENHRLSPGDIVYLKKKRKKAPRQCKGRPHIVKEGESMHSIAQFYGMQLKHLYRKNRLAPGHAARVGEQLKVY